MLASLGLSGGNSGEFAQTNNCGASLAPNANCTINVTSDGLAQFCSGYRRQCLRQPSDNYCFRHGVGIQLYRLQLVDMS
jgi:hypothetical protein